jgi:hypothetical protein
LLLPARQSGPEQGEDIGASSTGALLEARTAMNWLIWLGLAVLIAAVAAVTGVKAKGTRPVSHTRMMGVGRIALFAIVLIFAYLAFRARTGG